MGRKLFDLALNATPPLTRRVGIGESGISSENMTMQQLLDFTTTNLDVYTQAEIDTFLLNYLSKTNLTPYTPTLDYHPATKKYVIDGGESTSWLNMTAGAGATVIYAKVAQSNNHVIGTAKFTLNSGGSGVSVLNIPGSIDTSTINIYIPGTNADLEASGAFKLDAGTRIIKTDDDVDGSRVYVINFSYFTF
jgi:hypothetical protein